MNSSNDVDRRLADYLADGPSRASERPIASALDHARAHPRRRDPLANLRRDPMGSSRFGGGSGLRTLSLVAALGLLLIGALAVAAVGGLFDQRPVVVPPAPTFTPAPSASPTPVASSVPSAVPSASPAVIRIDLVDDIGGDAFVEITDLSGTLATARSGQASEGGEVVGEVGVANAPGDPATIVLTWIGSPCDTRHVLTIAADGRTMTITRAACQGDAMAIGRILVLTFDAPLPAGDVSVSLVTSGA